MLRCVHLLGLPCDEKGIFLPPGSPPPPRHLADESPSNPWNPFMDRIAFKFADYHFTELQSSEAQINQALDHWLASIQLAGGDTSKFPWRSAREMYATIDSIKEGPAPWKTVKFKYTGSLPPGIPPKWMLETYELCFRDPRIILLKQIALPDLQNHFDYAPYMQFNEKKDRVWSNLMSGSWAWEEAVRVVICLIFICSFRHISTLECYYLPAPIGTRISACSSCYGKRQNSGVCRNRAPRISSCLRWGWKYGQYNATLTFSRYGASCASSYSKK